MIRRPAPFISIALLSTLAFSQAAVAKSPGRSSAGSQSGNVKVRLETAEGSIVIRLDMKQAPITAGNFLRYVDEKRFDGTSFYRAARNRRNAEFGLVQGGVNRNAVRSLLPIKHEPTSLTGLKHGDGTISMARNAPGTAMGDFFITIGPASYLDARSGNPGYAAFGQVVGGMPIVRKILTARTYPGGWSAQTMGQSIVAPIRIIRARRDS
jgi:peptidyl-prolyl cis-trans isomerase A (cyclophilin A)